jgi:DnaJ-class molecular chaperone
LYPDGCTSNQEPAIFRNQIRYRCWSCVGNGLIAYPYQPLITCPDCKGSGIDQKKTREKLIERYRSLRHLGVVAMTAWYMAHKSY